MPQSPDLSIFEQFVSNPETFRATYICPGEPGVGPHDFSVIVEPIGINVLPPTHMCPEHHRMGILADSNLLPHT